MRQTIKIKPIAKPRMTQRDKWKPRKCVSVYWAYKDELKLKFKGSVSNKYRITFTIPMPKSWSKKKKQQMHLTPHTQKPDLDNLVKAFNDCLTDDDSSIHKIYANKIWGYEGNIRYEELLS